MESPSARGQNSPEYEQPVLPLPEFEQINRQPAQAEQIVAFNSLREYAQAWRDTIKGRLKREDAPDDAQLSFEYPPHETDAADVGTSGKDREKLEDLQSKRSFYAALGERALKAVSSGSAKPPEAPKPTSAFQRRVAHKTEKAIRTEAERQKIQKWNDTFFGTDRGKEADLRATKRAKRERRRELKRAYRDGVIDVSELEDGLRENMKTLVLKDTKERAAEKREARKAINKLRKVATQPLISRKLDQKAAKLSARLGVEETTETTEETDVSAPVATESPRHVRQEGNTFYYEKGTLFKPENAKKFDESLFRLKPQQKRRAKAQEKRGKTEKEDKKKSREADIPKEALGLFDRAELETSYKKIESAIEAGKAARLAELNEGKSESERIKVFPREELGEVVAEARRAEIEKMLGVDYSEENERLLMSAFTAIHRQHMQRAREEAEKRS